MTTAQASTEIPTGTWTVDPVHSSVGFSVGHLAGVFRAEFGEYEAELAEAGGEPRLTGVVNAASIAVDDENLRAHLLTPEFFDAERHPEIRFESTAVGVDADGLVVDGELTIKGITRAVQGRGDIRGPVAHFDPSAGDRIGIDLEAAVRRQDFGLDWNMEAPDGGSVLGDEVVIDLHLELRSAS